MMVEATRVTPLMLCPRESSSRDMREGDATGKRLPMKGDGVQVAAVLLK